MQQIKNFNGIVNYQQAREIRDKYPLSSIVVTQTAKKLDTLRNNINDMFPLSHYTTAPNSIMGIEIREGLENTITITD